MRQTLLEKMVEEAREEINKHNKPLSSEKFIHILYNVMKAHSKEIGDDWHAVFNNLVREIRKNEKRDWRILQAAKLQEEELRRLGGVHYDKETDCIFGLGEYELDEAI